MAKQKRKAAHNLNCDSDGEAVLPRLAITIYCSGFETASAF